MDLTGLSAEEAALISDVLSRLSIGSTPAASTVPQSTPAHGGLQDPTLMELDFAAWTLEQELRGLNTTSSLGPQHERFPQELFNPANPSFQGTHSLGDPHPLDGYSGIADAVAAYRANTGSGRLPPEPATPSQPAASATPFLPAGQPKCSVNSSRPVPQPQAVQAVMDEPLRPDGSDAGVVLAQEAPQSQRTGVTDAADRAFADLELTEAGAPSSSAPPAQMSLLKEMREKLRQQQNQQQAAEGPPNTDASRASSVNGSTAFGVGCKGTLTELSGHGSRAASVSPGITSPSSVAPSRARRALPSAPNSVAKAFTMLNARTSVDRYGVDSPAAEGQASTPTKLPVKLPEPERSARLQQLYERTAKWKRRCDERYAKERQDREASELEQCTFTPKVTTASQLIMQGKSPTEVYMELSKGGTPTKHQCGLQGPDGHPSPSLTASARATPVRTGATAAVDQSPSVGSTPTGNSAFAAGGGRTSTVSPASAPNGSGSSSASGGGPSISPQRPVVNGPQVGERLYQHAFELRARQEARFFRQLLEEERQRRFTASVQGVSSRVFDPPEAPATRHLPSGMKECTFYPSSFAGFYRRHKSAPHMRGAEGRHHSTPSPLFDIYGPSGVSGRCYMTNPLQNRRRATTIHRNVTFSPDLDWEEFLARQERFLTLREQRLQLLEQNETPASRMAPGSVKLLREREMRLSATAPEAAGQPGGQGGEEPARASSTLLSTQDRRVRTIMEMYKECTFQPRITRRASAMPGRQLEEFVDGGRARHEEWRQQQLALQQEREAEDLTFKPQIINKDAYSHIRPRISLKNPDAYLAHVAEKRRQREALRAELDNEREALELQQCTFKPQTTPLPAYLIRRLQEQHLLQLQAEGTPGQSIAWEDSSGGLGDIDCDAMPNSDDRYTHTSHELPCEFQPYRSGQQAGRVSSDQEADVVLDADMNSAYQRALHFAASLGQSSH